MTASDINLILAKRFDNGADFWATPDGRISKGSPFTTLDCALMLVELGVDPVHPVLKGTAELIFSALRGDGRFKAAPHGAIYPCYSINSVRALCYLGYAADKRLEAAFDHLQQTERVDGGWQCKKFSYGKGPETDYSNPGPILAALDGFRVGLTRQRLESQDQTVEFLLNHWTTWTPTGPRHCGIGSIFLQVTYPFSSYNLFFYVYVLSFYEKARQDLRFHQVLGVLEATLRDGAVIVQRPHQKLASLSFCRKGEPSERATMRYLEIRHNLE
ncbi:hypothetical protein [Arthrobacter sp. CAN_A1]|uniref:hypothetical protein n=1 Tax=Arthrobacter sp. CAN_A1 TaxID=2787717 RepID=UPI0018CA6660